MMSKNQRPIRDSRKVHDYAVLAGVRPDLVLRTNLILLCLIGWGNGPFKVNLCDRVCAVVCKNVISCPRLTKP